MKEFYRYMGGPKARIAALSFLFFISGVAGLIYEVVWSRYLSLIIGNTTHAHMTVLCTFLGGLALGNYWFGKKCEKVRNPVRLYGFMEIGVAAWCAFYPFFHRWIAQIDFSSLNSVHSGWAQSLVQLILCIAVLLVPTFLMGGSFPVVIRAVTEKIENVRSGVGLFYAINSFGAVIGSLLCSLVLIEKCGLDMTILAGAALSGITGLCGWLLSCRPDGEISVEASAPAEPEQPREFFTPLSILLMYAAIFLSGFNALLLEIGWFRFFALILGSTLYSFSLMLSAFILGITLGSIIASRIWSGALKPEKTFLYFGGCQIALSLSLALTFPLYHRLPFFFFKFASILNRTESTLWIYESYIFIFCFVLMLVPTLFSGMALPLASQWVAHYEGRLGASVGRTFALNLAGTMFGGLAAGLIFLPFFGVQGTLAAAAFFALASGISIFLLSKIVLPKLKAALPFMAFVCACLHFSYRVDWKWSLLSINPYSIAQNGALKNYSEFLKSSAQSKLLYYKDGADATVAVIEHPSLDRVLKINGKTDASIFGDLPTELLLGHLPMLMRAGRLEDRVTQALCIGFGSGITAGAVLEHPKTKLDLVEISPEVIEAAPLFSDHDHRVLENSACRLYIDDARTFLKAHPKEYDIIVSEPSNPRMPGTANLFTKEFFELTRARLAPDGLMVQWFHLYSMTDETVRMILRTFSFVYPYVHIWNSQSMDIIMVGSLEPLAVNAPLLRKRMSSDAVRRDLARIHIAEPSTLLLLETMASPLVEEMSGTGPMHTDFFPHLEFNAARALYLGEASDILKKYDQRNNAGNDLLLNRYVGHRELSWREIMDAALYIRELKNSAPFNGALFPSILEKMVLSKNLSIEQLQEQAVARLVFAQWYDRRGEIKAALELLSPLIRMPAVSADILLFYAELVAQEQERKISSLYQPDPEPVLRVLKQCMGLDPSKKAICLYRMAQVHFARGEYAKAGAYLEEVVQDKGQSGDRQVKADAMALLKEIAFEEKMDLKVIKGSGSKSPSK